MPATGLKPVHRRILYAMRELGLRSGGPFRKSAKISGDVMGNYHPHGDGAIYDAMARLAQDFTIRYPLVDGQGNFGNVDGDNPAASRYTEARLTAAAEALLDGLESDAVDFRGQLRRHPAGAGRPARSLPQPPRERRVGHCGWGMATAIPPHNLDELIAACLHLIRSPNARDETLLEHVPGPRLPYRRRGGRAPRGHRRGVPDRGEAGSGCAPAGASKSWARASGRSW